MDPITVDELAAWVESPQWERLFSREALDAGRRAVASRLVGAARGEILPGGDAEIEAAVAERDGGSRRPLATLWREGGELVVEGDCRCGEGARCRHLAALLLYLRKGKGERLRLAFGESTDRAIEAGRRALAPEAAAPSGDSPARPKPTEPTDRDPNPDSRSAAPLRPAFLLRVQRRPEGERSAWLPEIFASAVAEYGGIRAPLEPGGRLSPLDTPTGPLRRDAAAESEALRVLYACGLAPGAEEPPPSLRKLDRPPCEGTLWAPERRRWPDPAIYWQRFRHEAVPALEAHGWELRFAPEVGPRPLVFRPEHWSAEIVEEGRGWFHLSAGFEIEGERFELLPLLATLVKRDFLQLTEGLPPGQEFLVFLPDGRGLALPVGRFRRLLKTLGELVAYSFDGRGPLRLGKLDAARLLAGEDGEALAATAPAPVADLSSRLFEMEGFARRVAPLPEPEGLRATLRDYQREGYYWMQHLAREGLHGILADDMGLGKTLQTLAHLLAEIESGRSEGLPSLVVAPTSVVKNWLREAERFAPGLRAVLLHGPGREALFPLAASADLVLTSYALLHRDLEKLAAMRFHLLILDEAQYVKNPAAQVSQAARELDARHRLCLSGTPMENHLGELWSLFDFLMPGMLGSEEAFRATYQLPVERSGDEAKRQALAARVGPLILRRTKAGVATELPPKTEIIHAVEMNASQKELYETVRATMDKQVRQALAIRGQEAQIVFLDALLKLRQICCHPRLLDETRAADGSAKFDYLLELLATLREEGHRTLVFSQFTSMLALIEAALAEAGVAYLKLTGATRDRQELVERFQAGEGEVFLISLKAGGTGLTLTGADTVIHYDPWWNPATEAQATDRAYRIGQDKPVFVHKLICESTVEERIQQMQERKDALADELLAGATGRLPLSPEFLGDLIGEEAKS